MEPTRTLPDVELVLRSAEHMTWIRRLAARLVRDSHVQDDLVQESLLASWVRRASLRFPRAFGAAYLRQGRALAARGDSRRARREASAAAPESSLDPADAVERAELCGRVLAALAALDEPYRSTLALRFVDGLEPSDIAARTGVPAATVRSRVARGLERMRVSLDSAYHGERHTWVRGLVALSARRWFAASSLAAGVVVAVVGSWALWSGAPSERVTHAVDAARATSDDAVVSDASMDARPAREVQRDEIAADAVADAPTRGDEHRVLVTTVSGSPLPGARVELRVANDALDASLSSELVVASAITGADGRAVLALDASSNEEADRDVVVICPGRGRLRAALAVDQYEQRMAFRDTAPTFGPLRVLVVDDGGTPLAGATLVGMDDSGARDVETDAYGRALLERGDLHATSCTLVARGGIPETASIESDPFDMGARVVRASARVPTAMRVVDARTRRPVAGAVWREAGRVAFREVPYRTFARSDAFGRIDVKLPASRVTGDVACLVVVDAAGYVSTQVRCTDTGGAEREVLLEPERVIRGRVVDGSGVPQRDVDVIVHLDPAGPIFPVADPARPESAAQKWNWIGNRGALVRTDAMGAFELHGAPAAARGRVVLRDGETWIATPVAIEATPGSSVLELADLVRTPRDESEFAEIRGTVRFNGTAGPIPWKYLDGGKTLRGHADVDGSFRIGGLRPGKGTVVFQIPGLFVERRQVETKAGETLECSVDMECPVTAIRGTVVDADGRPRSGLLVTIRPQVRTLPDYGSPQAWTRADGSFETLAALETGTPLRMFVQRPGKPDVTVDGTAGVDVRIALPSDSAD